MAKSVFDETEAFKKGLAMRKQWLGEEHVARSMKSAEASPFTAPMQQYATEACWGQLWTRDALELKQRSLIVLGILGALNMEEELKLHTGAALRNGITEDEIADALLHVAVYAGVPRGIAAFRAAKTAVDAHGAAASATAAESR